jgi:RsiW-degrading membrane proteinase PrsW (M82 family)
MDKRRDPVEARDDGSLDLYDISTWDVRTRLDRLSLRIYNGLIAGGRALLLVAAVLILVTQFALGGLGTVTDPVIGAFVLLSVVPAALLAAYVWYADITTQEPLELIVATFVLGILFAGFAGLLNPLLGGVVATVGSGFGAFPSLGLVLLFYLVVGPVEETVKLLAVRLYSYRDERFDAVIDGAVYGAVAGLGFATIENAIYITGTIEQAGAADVVGTGSAIATVRALAGPGHVIYSAFAGYYLGLAKFNRDNAGPIVVKGLLIAAVIHATYNTAVSFVPEIVADAVGISPILAFFAFVVVYDSLFGYVLYRKLQRYRTAYLSVQSAAERDEGIPSERTEFEN